MDTLGLQHLGSAAFLFNCLGQLCFAFEEGDALVPASSQVELVVLGEKQD